MIDLKTKKLLKEFIVQAYSEIEIIDSSTSLFESITKKWSILDEYFDPKRHALLKEDVKRFNEAKLLIEGIVDKIKGFFGKAGEKFSGFINTIKKTALSLGDEAKKLVLKVAEKAEEYALAFIKSLPGGELLLEFFSIVGGKVSVWIENAKDTIKDKLTSWVEKAQNFLPEFFVKNVLTDDEERENFLKELGIIDKNQEGEEGQKPEEKKQKDQKIQDSVLRKYIGLIVEEESKTEKFKNAAKDTVDKIQNFRKASQISGEKTQDWVNLLAKGNIAVFRKKFASKFDALFEKWLKLLKENPGKYYDELHHHGFFNFLNSTGTGLALGSLLGLLGSSGMDWGSLVKYIKAFVQGATNPLSPPGESGENLGTKLFLGDKDNIDVSMFKNLLSGFIKGSNAEDLIKSFFLPGAGVEAKLIEKLGGIIMSVISPQIGKAVTKLIKNEKISNTTVTEATPWLTRAMFAGFGALGLPVEQSLIDNTADSKYKTASATKTSDLDTIDAKRQKEEEEKSDSGKTLGASRAITKAASALS